MGRVREEAVHRPSTGDLEAMKTPYVGAILGIFYVAAPFIFSYPVGFVTWQSVGIGVVILAISATFYTVGGKLPGWFLMFTAVYSMFSPFLHGFIDFSFAFGNNLLVGVVTMATGVAMAAAGLEYGRKNARAPAA